MKFLKAVVFVSYINEETFGATFGTRNNIEKYIAGWLMLYYLVLVHFLLFILNINSLFHFPHKKIFIILIASTSAIILLFTFFFLMNYKWTEKYYKEIAKIKISKKMMWVLALFFEIFPILYFYITLFLLKIPS